MDITYWSDYACPYCYIGEARLKKALEQTGLKDSATLTMKAFQLDPNAPEHAEGDTVSRYGAKYGQTPEQAAASVAHISALGQAEGLDFAYADTLFTNTMDAHRLTKLAESKGDPALVEKLENLLFKAYFADGLELADHDVLMQAGLAAGLAEEEIRQLLAGDAYYDEVRQDEREAAALGVHGVPYFVIDGMLAIPGTLTTEGFAKVLTDQLPQVKAAAQGESCGPDGCRVRQGADV